MIIDYKRLCSEQYLKIHQLPFGDTLRTSSLNRKNQTNAYRHNDTDTHREGDTFAVLCRLKYCFISSKNKIKKITKNSGQNNQENQIHYKHNKTFWTAKCKTLENLNINNNSLS